MSDQSFFSTIGARLYQCSLSPNVQNGLSACLAEGRKRRLNKPTLAYLMATAHYETDGTFDPGKREDMYYTTPQRLKKVFPSKFKMLSEAEPYLRNPEKLANYVYANKLGNGDEASGDGWTFRGGGPSQLTGRDNYKELGLITGLPLVGAPELACIAPTAWTILFTGMIDGIFTGHALRRYIHPGVRIDFKEARRCINGMFEADVVAELAETYLDALAEVDLLSDSNTVANVTAQKGAILKGAGAVIAAGGASIADAIVGDADNVVSAVNTGMTLDTLLPWAGGIFAGVALVAFLILHRRAKNIENERAKIAERS